MELLESVANTAQNGDKPAPDETKKRTRYPRKPKEHAVLEDIHMSALVAFRRFEFLTYEMAHHVLTVDFPHLSERDIADIIKLLHHLGYLMLIPRDTHKPNIFQIDKKGAKELTRLGVERESLSVYTGFPGILDHKEMRDYFGTVLAHVLKEDVNHPSDIDAWEREYVLTKPKTRTEPEVRIQTDVTVRLVNRRGGKNRLAVEIHTGSQWSGVVIGDKVTKHLLFHKHLPDIDGADSWHTLFISRTKGQMDWLLTLARKSPHLWFHNEESYKKNYQNVLVGWTAGDGATHMLTE
jgi:hypothetical protein